MRLPGSNPHHVLEGHVMVEASLSLIYVRPACLGPPSDFSPFLCPAGASAVPRLCLGKSLIFLNCVSMCRLLRACP